MSKIQVFAAGVGQKDAIILRLSEYSPTSSGPPSKAQEDGPEHSAKVQRSAQSFASKIESNTTMSSVTVNV